LIERGWLWVDPDSAVGGEEKQSWAGNGPNNGFLLCMSHEPHGNRKMVLRETKINRSKVAYVASCWLG
jgi:hypothetical protein